MSRRVRRRPRPKIIVPLAAMGDIAFQLIIFFILCGNFTKSIGVELEFPQLADIEVVEETDVYVAVDDQGRIFFNGDEVPDSEAIKWGVMAMIERRGGEENPMARRVFVQIDRLTDRTVYEPIEEAIAEAGGVMVIVGEPIGP